MDRVLEIGHFAAGYCGRLFAQTGHDVVRVEPETPKPGWVSGDTTDIFLHAGKRRITGVDRNTAAELAAKAEVVILEADNAEAAAEWGIDAWPAPVKVTVTPFGRTGPKRNWQAAPATLLAMGGYTNLMGDPDRAPLSLPGYYTEFQSGQFAFTAASACRFAGQKNNIDISMLEVLLSLSQFTTVMWHCTGRIRSRHGSDFWWVVPTNLFRCSDGWIYVNIVPTFWDPFGVFLNMPELAIDSRFQTNALRMENRDALHALIAATLVTRPKSEWQARATDSRIPAGVVQTFDEILDDPHLRAREFWHQTYLDVKSWQTPGLPFRINDARWPDTTLEAPTAGDSDG